MPWAHVLRPPEMAAHRRCRRQWDLGARLRQNYVPAVPANVFDFGKAIHDALAVYYFPAMDDWDRAIVRPLAVKGFHRSLQQERQRYEAVAELNPGQEEEFTAAGVHGERLLNAYFTWATPLDTFASIFADQEYWAGIPDPASPDDELSNHLGRELRYLGRVDQLFSDTNDEYWVADHRVVSQWEDDEMLLLDTQGLTDIWATERTYPQLRIAGSVYNELHIGAGADPDAAAAPGPDYAFLDPGGRTMEWARHVHTRRSPLSPDLGPIGSGEPADYIARREDSRWFRRTFVRRARGSVAAAGQALAAEAIEVARPDVALYPSPSPESCRACAFQAPCIAMNEGLDPAPLLAQQFRVRTEEEGEEERLRWSLGRAQTRASMSGKDSRPNTVNFLWG